MQGLMDRIGAQVNAGGLGDHQSDHRAAVEGIPSRNGPGEQLGDDDLEHRVRLAYVALRRDRYVGDIGRRNRRIAQTPDLDGAALAVVPDRLERHPGSGRGVHQLAFADIDRGV